MCTAFPTPLAALPGAYRHDRGLTRPQAQFPPEQSGNLTGWRAWCTAASLPPDELSRVGFRLYERFRPDVPDGVEGWGECQATG